MPPIPFAEIRTWMFDEALPFWGEKSLDHEGGGFLEELDMDGGPADIAFKRVRVTCRQVYAFSHAAMLGWAPGNALAERGFDYLVQRVWQGAERGWARRMTRMGAVLDGTPDLYDIAFALYAMAWRYRASGDARALQWAHTTLDFVHQRMKAREGYWHALPPTGPRLQNPHMHLLEASLAAFDATNDQRFLDEARGIVSLFKTRLFDGRTLGEYFNEDWSRLEGERGRVTEPGHHFEWAWILGQYARITGEDVSREAAALIDFAEQHGVNHATGFAFNQIRDDGAPLDASSRSWPNTERIKGHLALFEMTGADPRGPVLQTTRLLLDRYLAVSPRGGWIDHFDADGRPTSQTMPTSILYHMFLAFAEILRLEPKLNAL